MLHAQPSVSFPHHMNIRSIKQKPRMCGVFACVYQLYQRPYSFISRFHSISSLVGVIATWSCQRRNSTAQTTSNTCSTENPALPPGAFVLQDCNPHIPSPTTISTTTVTKPSGLDRSTKSPAQARERPAALNKSHMPTPHLCPAQYRSVIVQGCKPPQHLFR